MGRLVGGERSMATEPYTCTCVCGIWNAGGTHTITLIGTNLKEQVSPEILYLCACRQHYHTHAH